MKTSNLHRKRNASALVLVTAVLIVIGSCIQARAQELIDLTSAVQPMAEGVPQVSIVRLQDLLSRDLSDDDRRAASVSLAEAYIAAGEAEKAVPILNRPLLRGFSAAYAAINKACPAR